MLQIRCMRGILLIAAIVAAPAFATAQPGAATPVSATASTSYTFVWNRVPGATFYYLWVNEGSTPKYTVWHTAAQANCGGSQPTCAVTVALPPVAFGNHNWWVQAYNLQGYGPWSAAKQWTSRPASSYVIDAAGKVVGPLTAANLALLIVNGQPADAAISSAGFSIQGVQLLYLQNSCAGQPYTFALIPDRLFFGGSLANGYLARGAPITATVLSFRQINPDGSLTTCSAISQVITLMPLTQINMTTQLGGFVGPFSVVR